MVNDPYSVLGITKDATPEEIKKAYRTQAKKYHPDLHPDDPVAAQKMNDVNEAYDMLTNPEKYAKKRAEQEAYTQRRSQTQGQSYGGYNSGNSNQSGPGGWSSDYWGFDFSDFFGFGYGGGYGNAQRYDTKPKPENGDTVELVRAISAVNAGRYQEAVEILSKMTSVYRNARYYYVAAIAFRGLGEYEQAEGMIERAIRLDSQNQMYLYLYRQIRSESRQQASYSQQANPFGSFRSIMLMLIIFNIIMMLFGYGGCSGMACLPWLFF